MIDGIVSRAATSTTTVIAAPKRGAGIDHGGRGGRAAFSARARVGVGCGFGRFRRGVTHELVLSQTSGVGTT